VHRAQRSGADYDETRPHCYRGGWISLTGSESARRLARSASTSIRRASLDTSGRSRRCTPGESPTCARTEGRSRVGLVTIRQPNRARYGGGEAVAEHSILIWSDYL
jgi:hypothetical protein